MRALTIKEAKAHLNALVEAAVMGEEVVLMRGSKHVAAIVPLSAEDLEIAPRLTDEQADRFWRQLAADRARGAAATFETAGKAVEKLKHRQRAPPRRRGPKARSSS